MRPTFLIRLFILIPLLLGNLVLQAAQVAKVKNNHVLIELGSEKTKVGARYLTIDAAGKKRAIVRILQIRKGQAVAEIEKGIPAVGHTLRALKLSGAAAASADSGNSTASGESEDARDGDRWLTPKLGFLIGYSADTMSIAAKRGSSSETVNMSNSSYNFDGFYDYPFGDTFGVRLTAGYDPFNAVGIPQNTYVCNDQTNCNVSLNFLSGGGILTAQYAGQRYRIWAGVGVTMLYAVSKTSNIYNFDQSNSIYQSVSGDLGFDYFISSSHFIPAQFEYDMYPGGSGVTVSQMKVRIGYGFTF